MGSGTSQKNIQAIEKVCEIIEKRLDYLLQTDDGHRRRATTIFGFGGVILSIAFSLYLRGSMHLLLFISGIGFIFGSLLLALIVMLSWKVVVDPKPRSFSDKYIGSSRKDVLLRLIAQLRVCFERNEAVIRKRAFIVDWGFVCMFTGLVLVALSLLIN